ncbi:WHG domain-containing protein [Streptomyces sp. NPDC051286]|uniref:WHG domain-containing protein n=1 Tax=Streptomyces sp. NPDC051286 TaxID=3365647 RepID=UPI0037ACD024
MAAEAYTRFALERPHHFRLLAEPPGDADSLEGIADLVDEQNAKLTSAIRDGVADGSFNPDVDPRSTASAPWAPMNGILGLTRRADRLRVDPQDMGRIRRHRGRAHPRSRRTLLTLPTTSAVCPSAP